MGKISEILKLTRIEHSFLLLIAVIAAELMTKGLPSPPIFILSLVTPVFISMAAFAINDYFDIKVDKLNGKKRPLVLRTLKPNDALYVTAFCLVIGLASSALINVDSFVIALIFGALALLYSYKLKELLFWGNAYIALSMAIPFIFGDYVVSSALGANVVFVCIMIFFSGLAREIHGTIRDYSGDVLVRDAHTIPKEIGIKPSAYLAYILYIAAILVSIYLFIAVKPFQHNLVYALPIFATDIILVCVSTLYIKRGAKKHYGITRNLSLFAMGLALAAILFSSFL